MFECDAFRSAIHIVFGHHHDNFFDMLMLEQRFFFNLFVPKFDFVVTFSDLLAKRCTNKILK